MAKNRDTGRRKKALQPARQAETLLTSLAAEIESTPFRIALDMWRRARVAYRLDETLLDELMTTDLKVVPPVESFSHLPHEMFVATFGKPIELFDADDDMWRRFTGVLVHGVTEPTTDPVGRHMIGACGLADPKCFVYRGLFFGTESQTGRQQAVTSSLPGPASNFEGLSEYTLEEFFADQAITRVTMLADAREMSIDDAKATGMVAQTTLRMPLGVLLAQLLLYLASPEPDFVESDLPPLTHDELRKTGGKPAATELFDIGWRLGPRLREARRPSNSRGETHGDTLRAHVRRGHWHTYLYGPRGGDRERRLKWVHPTIVNWSDQQLQGVQIEFGEPPSDRVGVDYREADEYLNPNFTGDYEPAPDLRGRGARAHAWLQNELANALRRRGRAPLSPSINDPQFDVAWEGRHELVVVEVKSLGSSTETHQMRLGIAQALEYRFNLTVLYSRPVTAMLYVERQPSNEDWAALCSNEDIVLAWPETLSAALDSHC